jgi:hypothetical protein
VVPFFVVYFQMTPASNYPRRPNSIVVVDSLELAAIDGDIGIGKRIEIAAHS